MDHAAVSLADRIDKVVSDESRRAARRKGDDGGESVERAVMAVLYPPAPRLGPGRRRVYDRRPDGELVWRYEDEPPAGGNTPVEVAG